MALDFSNVMTGHYGQMIIDGTVVTLELALGAWLLAMFIALVLVMIRLSNKRFAQLCRGVCILPPQCTDAYSADDVVFRDPDAAA